MDKIDKKQTKVNKDCFVISLIGSEGSRIRKRADQILKYVLSRIPEKYFYTPIRAEQKAFSK